MKKFIVYLFGVLVLILIAAGAVFAWKNLRGIGPVIKSPPEDITKLITDNNSGNINTTGMPLKLPAGFSISIFAKDLPGARVMTFDHFGNMWVSRTSEGVISFLEIDQNAGQVKHQGDVIRNLKKPHGLAFDPDPQNITLYFAEENKISRVATYSEDSPYKIIDLPSGGNHFTRTLGFGPDGRLYVSIGSTCNVCHESDSRRAAIYSFNKDGSDFQLFAKGLRNSVFFVWHPVTKKMWATEMGRDLLGDDIPPDEINIVEAANPSTGLGVRNYGWPICYGANMHDTNFDHNTYIRNPCMEPFETPSLIDIPAHSAPLGLVFAPDTWPTEYRGNLLVAYHGSWNRSTPTGYKVVRIIFNDHGEYQRTEDFITGWLDTAKGAALGRPVDLVVGPDHALYLSDDKAGVIYKITPPRPITPQP